MTGSPQAHTRAPEPGQEGVNKLDIPRCQAPGHQLFEVKTLKEVTTGILPILPSPSTPTGDPCHSPNP